MDPSLLQSVIGERTRAIIPVHLFGHPADMSSIRSLADRHGIPVIEDACQAHGARYEGRRAGSLGLAGCFSFYPGKNLGAFGEAGAVVTSDEELARSLRTLRDHGQRAKYDHVVPGWNGRMDGIQGAILSVKLPHLDAWNEARRGCAASYAELLGGIPNCQVLYPEDWAEPVYHLYELDVADRPGLMECLASQQIGCGIHYPVPIHRTGAYKQLGYTEGAFPVAERAATRLVSLPMYVGLTRHEQEYVANSIRDFESTTLELQADRATE
jgi:dTDP-4-amino-4,6-dideoxygalactose transaminase